MIELVYTRDNKENVHLFKDALDLVNWLFRQCALGPIEIIRIR